MKKRLIACVAAGLMAASLIAGCGGSASSGSSAASSGSSTASSGSSASSSASSAASSADSSAASSGSSAASGNGYNMSLVLSQRDEFRSSLEAACQQVAKDYGINLSTQDANNDTGKMLQFIESSRNVGDDAVLVNLIDSETAPECVNAAGDMKLVFINISPADLSCLNESAAMVCSNENEAGGFQGKALAEYFNAKGQTDVRYILLKGTLGVRHTEERTNSCLEAMKEGGLNPIPVTEPLVAEYDRATALDMISPLLGTTEFDCVICNNDSMALGAIEAMKAAGLDPSETPVVGIDATVDGRDAVKNGDMYMTVFQNPIGQGSASMMAAINMLEGNELNAGTDYQIADTSEYAIWVPFEPVNKDNVADYD